MQGLVWNDLNFGGEITALSDTFTFQKIMKNLTYPIYFAGYRPLAMLYELKSPTTHRQSEIFIVLWKPKRQIISPISKHLNEPFNFQKCLTCNFMK